MFRLLKRKLEDKRDSTLAQDKLWRIISETNLPFGPDYLKFKLGWGLEFAKMAIEEYRRFIFLVLISKKEVTPSQIVDEVWHYHILHTQAYQSFAKEIGKYIHHNPGTASEQPRFDNQYLKTLRFYTLVFNSQPPPLIWPGQDSSFCSGILPKAA